VGFFNLGVGVSVGVIQTLKNMDFSPLGWITLTLAGTFSAVKFFGKTYLEETIKGQFAHDLENFKAKLTLEVTDRIEPFKTGLAVLANRQGVIFNLEKEAIVEFNEAINTWFWQDMEAGIHTYTEENFGSILKGIEDRTTAFQRTQICYSKMELIVENDELNKLGRNAVIRCHEMKAFMDDKLSLVHDEIASIVRLQKIYFNPENVIEMPSEQKGALMNVIVKANENKNGALKEYKENYLEYSKKAIESVGEFSKAAKAFMKNN
jgi:hypothetical protein